MCKCVNMINCYDHRGSCLSATMVAMPLTNNLRDVKYTTWKHITYWLQLYKWSNNEISKINPYWPRASIYVLALVNPDSFEANFLRKQYEWYNIENWTGTVHTQDLKTLVISHNCVLKRMGNHRLKTYYVPGIGNGHMITITMHTNAMKHCVRMASPVRVACWQRLARLFSTFELISWNFQVCCIVDWNLKHQCIIVY